ncbi:MAG: GT4 family glycosyltransferase PelF [Candidatus Omnitrophota bacterium]|nr:GT4 family glycosyltransferase PelF [Candidatus Omnitrophota bacterium]
MKILQILPELNVGGVERGVVDLARRLVLAGHQAVVISNGGRLVSQLESLGVKHYLLPVNKKSLFSIWSMIKKVENILRKENVSIVHARSRVPAWIAYFACRRSNTKFITTAHGYYNTHFFSRVMGWGKRVITPSQPIAKRMIEQFGVPEEKIRLVPRGLDLNEFSFQKKDTVPGNEVVVGFIGRITPLKGHVYFIKAISKVARKIPGLKVLIVGDSPAGKHNYKEQIMLLARRLGLTPYIKFLGTRADIPDILAELDILVMASTAPEAFGRVLIEAGAAGIPVVATKIGGVVDIVDNEKTGLLVAPRDPQQMAEAIIRLIKDKNLAVSLAEAAREKVAKEFNLDLMAERTINVYKEVEKETKILITKFGSAGDLILVIPSLRAIRKRFPGSKITLLVEPGYLEIIQRCSYLDDIVTYDRRQKDRFLKRTIRLVNRLKQVDFDMVIDFQNTLRSHLISYLSCAPKRYGYARGIGKFLLTDKAGDFKAVMPPLKHQLRVLNLLGIDKMNEKLELWPSKEDEKKISNLFLNSGMKPGQLLVGINPGGSKRWVTKRWPLEKFAKLSNRLSQQLKAKILITGIGEETELGKKLVSLMKKNPINVIGRTTPGQLACLIKRCQVYVTGDSAPMHVAAAMGTKLVALFGPTNPVRHLPSGNGHIVIKKQLKCSPCYKPNCLKHSCMEEITVDEVLDAVKKQLEKNC